MVGDMIRIFGSALNSNTDFSTNGLGVLSEAISCIVVEERNGIYELEMEYPVVGARSDYLQPRNIIVAKPNPYSDPQPFRIYSIQKGIRGTLIVKAAHISYDLNGYVAQVLQNPCNGLRDYFTQLTNELMTPNTCPFTFTTTTTASTEFKVKDILPIRKILGESGNYTPQDQTAAAQLGRIVLNSEEWTGYVLDVFPGEYEWDGLQVKHYQTMEDEQTGKVIGGRGSNRGVHISYGKNLTDYKQEENCQDIYTAIYPYWHYDGYRHELVELPERFISVPGNFDFVKILPMDLTSAFARRPSEDDMRNYVNDYIKKNDIGSPKVDFDVSFLPLSQTEEYKDYAVLETVKLCDTITVDFPMFGVSSTAKVTKTEYDVIGGKYTSISLDSFNKLGNQTASNSSNLVSTIASLGSQLLQKIVPTELQSAVLSATERLTGQVGGYVMLNTSSSVEEVIEHVDPETGEKTYTHVYSHEQNTSDSGSPNEILIMDTNDKNTAQNIWCWNINGLGFSSNGINGPYSVAITSDGQVNADFITAGLISGERIKAGTITATQIDVNYGNAISNEIRTEFQLADDNLRSVITNLSNTLDGTMSDYYAQLSSLTQDFNAITMSFSDMAVGGINKIQNSSGLNGTTDWTLSVNNAATTFVDDDADAGKGFKITNGNMSQTFSVNQGEKYVLSFRAKTTTSSLSQITIDGVSELVSGDATLSGDRLTALSKSEIGDFGQKYITFKASSNTATVTLSSAGDSLFVSDLIVAQGTNKCNWSPAPNEIYTTNVKIDRRGIEITNTDSSTTTLIDNTQFAVKSNDEIVLTVNKESTILQKTEVHQELLIGNPDGSTGQGYFVPVEDGVDFVIA